MMSSLAMSSITFCFLLFITLCFGTPSRSVPGFSIPDIEIVALKPKGLKLLMQHVPEICMVTFHGNVNRPIAGSAPGEISLEASVPIGDKWELKNHETKLNANDEIHYWMFVQYKQIGFRKSGIYRIDGRPTPAPTVIPKLESAGCHCPNVGSDGNRKVLEDVDKIRNDTLLEISSLTEILRTQTQLLNTMKQVMTEFLRTTDYGLKLKLLGPPLPKQLSPLNAINVFVGEKLNITMTDNNLITKASLVDDGIVFEVETEFDKSLILRNAKESLVYSHYKIIDNTVPCQIDVRSSFT